MNSPSFNFQEIILEGIHSLLDKLPQFFFTLILFLLGCLVAIWLGKITTRILKKLRVDHIFQKNSWQRGLEKSGIKTGLSDAAGWVVRWLLILIFMAIASETMGLDGVSVFLMSIVKWLPNLLIALLIFIVAAILTDVAGNAVRISINWIDASYGFIAEKLIRWMIWGLAVLIIFKQIGIVPEMTIILFQGLVYFVVLALGLAFGLGGQEIARDFLKHLKDKIKQEK